MFLTWKNYIEKVSPSIYTHIYPSWNCFTLHPPHLQTPYPLIPLGLLLWGAGQVGVMDNRSWIIPSGTEEIVYDRNRKFCIINYAHWERSFHSARNSPLTKLGSGGLFPIEILIYLYKHVLHMPERKLPLITHVTFHLVLPMIRTVVAKISGLL